VSGELLSNFLQDAAPVVSTYDMASASSRNHRGESAVAITVLTRSLK
jgi:hypothetical protein